MGRRRSNLQRNSAYYKKHWWVPTRYTVKEGEQMAVWDRRGRQNLYAGPCRKVVMRSRVTFHDMVTADQNQYLVITKTDGTVQHERGPSRMYVDPVLHQTIEVKPAIRLEGMESIVVNASNVKSKEVDGDKGMGLSRNVVSGPTLYFPAPNETVQVFCWHGEDPEHKTRLIPAGRRFAKLCMIPEQFYFNVKDVRTADDALITVKLMVFYQLVDIGTMLSNTTDPIAEFMNALTSDIVSFASRNTFEEVLTKTSDLGDMQTFPSLTTVAPTIGFKVEKVVYRGYQASQTLQNMHNTAITERNNLKLRAEKTQQDIEIKSHELDKTTEMAHKSNTNEMVAKTHELEMKAKRFEAKMKQLGQKHEAKLERVRMDNNVELEQLQDLRGKGVELTPYLLASMDKADKIIKVVGAGGAPAGDDGSDVVDLGSSVVRGRSQVSLQFS